MKIDLSVLPEDVHQLRRAFVKHGKDIFPVGGWVRDMVHAQLTDTVAAPKDLDFATNASVEEMQAIADATPLVIKLIPTGIDHGTLSFVLESGLYEITCMREETGHDGRHAICIFGQDLAKDLARRDLTINALACDFEGEVIDLFNGVEDLKFGRVRFVGDATTRMTEDYLRILRWLRFHGRFGRQPIDFDAMLAAQDVRQGLAELPAERVWAEMGKIIEGPKAAYLLHYLVYMRLDDHLRMAGPYDVERFRRVAEKSADKIVRLVAFIGDHNRINTLADAWRFSAEEKTRAFFLAKEAYGHRTRLSWLGLMGTCDKATLIDLAILREDDAGLASMRNWDIPVFPLRGQDLVDIGFKPSPKIGYTLDILRTAWAHEQGAVSKEDLLRCVTPETRFE